MFLYVLKQLFYEDIVLSATILLKEAEIEKLVKTKTLRRIKDDFSENNHTLHLSFVYSFSNSICTKRISRSTVKDYRYGDETTIVFLIT